MKKIVSLLLIFTLSISIGTISFADSYSGMESLEIIQRLGGGASPSAVWTETNKEISILDLRIVNKIIYIASKANKDEATNKDIYNLVKTLGGYLRKAVATTINVTGIFGTTFDIPADTVMNMQIARSYLEYIGPGSRIVVEYPVYEREATSEVLVGAPYVKNSIIVDNYYDGVYN